LESHPNSISYFFIPDFSLNVEGINISATSKSYPY
jgi:hypothetical protein